ncbi:MAG: lysylphosphatidylglycerol synthase domain-containing protein [Bacteroidota bacterium]
MTNKRIFSALKIIGATASVAYIIYTAYSRPDVVKLFTNPVSILVNYSALIMACILFIVNWGIETIKWRMLIQSVESLGWWRAFLSVMSGTTVSLFGPNRTGEFAGRALHFSSGNKVKAAVCSIPGNLAQLLVTLVMGIVALFYVESPFQQIGMKTESVLAWLCMLVLVLVSVYWSLPLLRKRVGLTSFYNSVKEYVGPVFAYSNSLLLKVFVWSFLRYLVFTTQFYLMLVACGVQIHWFDAFASIAVVYLFMAVIPGFAITEFTVRGSVALFLMAPLTANATGVLAASAALWLINLVLPALIGGVAIYSIKIKD